MQKSEKKNFSYNSSAGNNHFQDPDIQDSYVCVCVRERNYLFQCLHNIPCSLFKYSITVLASATHMLKLERYKED